MVTPRDQSVSRSVGNLVLSQCNGLGVVENVAGYGDIVRRGYGEGGAIGNGGLSLARAREGGDVAIDVEHGGIALHSASRGVVLVGNTSNVQLSAAGANRGGVGHGIDGDRRGATLRDRVHLSGGAAGGKLYGSIALNIDAAPAKAGRAGGGIHGVRKKNARAGASQRIRGLTDGLERGVQI